MSMDDFKDLPLEVRLSALIDGQVSEEDARELEALLASDPEAQRIHKLLRAGSDFGNQAFEAMLADPVPLKLARSIKEISAAPKPARQAANSNVVSFFKYIPQAIAASAVLLMAGGYAGYYVGANNASMPSEISETTAFEAAPAGEAKTRGFTFDAPAASPVVDANATRAITKSDIALSEIAGAHKVYAADKAHADEVPAAQESELVGFLEAVTSVKFKVPDLSAEGYKLRGGKLAVVVGQPTAALFYEKGDGSVVGVYLMKNAEISGVSQPTDGFVVLGGQKADTSYFIAAQDEALAKKLEGNVSAAL